MERYDKIEEEHLLSNSNETKVEETYNSEEEETLSLCDLPIEQEIIQSRKETLQQNNSIQDEFDFCSFSKESAEMCSADQLFFHGQILPFHHYISSETGLISARRYLPRSESMNNFYSNGFTSSRSSSINSHQSSSCSSSSIRYSPRSSVTTPIYKPRVPNSVISHQSPKPLMKNSIMKNQNMPSSTQKTTMWSHFRLGLVTTPEIVLEDLKHRSFNSNKSFQKSTSFGTHGIIDSDYCTRFKSEKKKKQGTFEVNGTLLGSCKCSSNAVDIIPSQIGSIKTNVNAKDGFMHEEMKGKQAISRHRTFEWLKQLSLDSIASSL
ncbi:hypothetical protein Leryth_018543 [Lithospermum erythrorhizon]|nr:hypothetical protein Leryth_018543 [Lithospermum erythrorhizon]